MNLFHELRKFFDLADCRTKFMVLLLFRSPFDYILACYNANLLYQSFRAIELGEIIQLKKVILCFLTICLIIFSYNCTMWSIYATFVVGVQGKISRKLYHHIAILPDEVIESHNTGEWITRTNSDVTLATQLIGGALNLPHATFATIRGSLSLLVLLLYDWRIAAVTLVFIIPQIILNQKYIVRPMLDLRKKVQERIAIFTGKIEPWVTCSDIIRIYDAKDMLYHKMMEDSNQIRKAQMKIHIRNAVATVIVNSFRFGGYLAVIAIVSMMMMKGHGSLAQLMSVLQFHGEAMIAINMLTVCITNIQSNLAGIKRVNEVFYT